MPDTSTPLSTVHALMVAALERGDAAYFRQLTISYPNTSPTDLAYLRQLTIARRAPRDRTIAHQDPTTGEAQTRRQACTESRTGRPVGRPDPDRMETTP